MGIEAPAQVKRPESEVDHSTPSSGNAKKAITPGSDMLFFFIHTGTTLLLLSYKWNKHRFVTRKPPTFRNVSNYKLIVVLSKYGKVQVDLLETEGDGLK